MLLIKIEFDNTLTFSEGCAYTFVHKQSGHFLKMDYRGLSRIDGLPLFETVNNSPHAIIDFEYRGNNIKQAHLIKPLEDNRAFFLNDYTRANKEKLLEFFLEHFDINDEDLKPQDSYKSIIRDIKLGKIL